MAIQWEVAERQGVSYSINCNIIATGSKKLGSNAAKETLMADQPQKIRVLIVDAEDEDRVLVDEEVGPKGFSTGSVGYSVQARGVSFGD